MAADSPYVYEGDLRQHAPITECGLASRIVQNTQRLRVVQFTFAAGHGLAAHTAPHPVTLTFLSGQARVRVGAQEVSANEGTFLSLPPNLEHSIEAESEVVMVLTMIK